MKRVSHSLLVVIIAVLLIVLYNGYSFLKFKKEYRNLLVKQTTLLLKHLELELKNGILFSDRIVQNRNSNIPVFRYLISYVKLNSLGKPLAKLPKQFDAQVYDFLKNYIVGHPTMNFPIICFDTTKSNFLYILTHRQQVFQFNFRAFFNAFRNELPNKVFLKIIDNQGAIIIDDACHNKFIEKLSISFFDHDFTVLIYHSHDSFLSYIQHRTWTFFLFFIIFGILVIFFLILWRHIHKTTEKELEEKTKYTRELKDYINNILNLSPNIIISLDKHCNVTYWNKKAVGFFQISIDQILHKNLFKDFAFLDEYEKDVLSVIQNRQQIVRVEQKFKNNMGTHYLDIVIYPIRKYDVVIDINVVTDKINLRTKMTRYAQFELMEKIFKQLTHKYNNLMSGVVGYIELARNEKSIRTIKQYLQELRTIIVDMLSYTGRLEGFIINENKEDFTLVNIVDVCYFVLKSLETVLQKKIILRQKVSSANSHVMGNFQLLVKILSDLFLTMIDACAKSNEQIIVTISENVEEKKVSILFQSLCFTSLIEKMQDVSNFESCLGSDLSAFKLISINNVVRKHNGEILYDIEKSILNLEFPKAHIHEKLFDEIHIQDQALLKSILVVDDEKEIVKFISIFLEKLGAKVSVAYSGDETITILKKQTFDLILLDFILPDMSAKEIIQKANLKNTDIKIILMTGLSLRDKTLDLQNLPYQIIRKPFSLNELLKKIYTELGS